MKNQLILGFWSVFVGIINWSAWFCKVLQYKRWTLNNNTGFKFTDIGAFIDALYYWQLRSAAGSQESPEHTDAALSRFDTELQKKWYKKVYNLL